MIEKQSNEVKPRLSKHTPCSSERSGSQCQSLLPLSSLRSLSSRPPTHALGRIFKCSPKAYRIISIMVRTEGVLNWRHRLCHCLRGGFEYAL